MRDERPIVVAGIVLLAAFVANAPLTRATISLRPGQVDPGTGRLVSGASPPHLAAAPGWSPRVLRPVSGMGRVVALLVDFPDRPANTVARPGSFYQDLLFSRDVLPTGSLRDFYLEQSYGSYDITGEAYGWLHDAESYYDTFDDGNFGGSGGARGVCIAATLLADPEVDFGAFDSDGADGIPNSGDDDGYVDACVVFCSQLGGHDTLDPSDIWPVIVSVDPPYETDDAAQGGGVIKIDHYSIQPEINLDYPTPDTLETSLSVVAHEYGHLIGLPDLYDKSYTTWGIGYWGLMGYGAFGYQRTGPYQMSAWSKVQLGWVTPTTVTSTLANVTLPPVETDPVVYEVWPDSPGEEYFLIENRQNLLHDAMLPGRGLLIWHVDESRLKRNAAATKTPVFGFWLGLEQADGRDDMNRYFDRPDARDYYPEMGDGGDPYPGDSLNTVFDRYSNPSSHDDAGNPTGVAIRNIRLESQDVHLDISIGSVAVFFRSLQADVASSGIELTWSVRSDESLAGFRIYRRLSRASDFVRISSPTLLPTQSSYVDADARETGTYVYRLSAVTLEGTEISSPTVQATVRALAPTLAQNAPNPFNPRTAIAFSLPETRHVALTVHDLAGKRVRTLRNETLPAGLYQVWWDGEDEAGRPVGSGVYLYELQIGRRTLSRKMTLLR
jgi:M6 family metalloprotease-like protein